MKQTMAVLAVVSMLATGTLVAPQPALSADKHRVVLQVSDGDPAKWNLALNNARNIQASLGKENVQIEIVAYGPGLMMMKSDSKVAGRLNAALDQGIHFGACGNTMKNMKVEEADLVGGVGVVQEGGVVRIIQRQREGWSYIRP